MGGSGATLIDLAVQAPLEQLRSALAKVYADKRVTATLEIAPSTAYPIDAGDFLELAGNLMDNAFKYGQGARRRARCAVDGSRTGAGPASFSRSKTMAAEFPPVTRARVLERGARADESVAGQGIGLAAVARSRRPTPARSKSAKAAWAARGSASGCPAAEWSIDVELDALRERQRRSNS